MRKTIKGFIKKLCASERGLKPTSIWETKKKASRGSETASSGYTKYDLPQENKKEERPKKEFKKRAT